MPYDCSGYSSAHLMGRGSSKSGAFPYGYLALHQRAYENSGRPTMFNPLAKNPVGYLFSPYRRILTGG